MSMDINPSMPVRGPSIGQGGPKFMDPWWSKHFRGGPYIMDPLGPYSTLYLDWGSKYNVIFGPRGSKKGGLFFL